MNEEDKKIRMFITNDQKISDTANKTFDDFIEKIKDNEIYKEKLQNNIEENYSRPSFFLRFRQVLAVAATLLIVMFGSNVYAKSQGYDNIFFLIKDIVTKEDHKENEIFSDRDIVISYKPIQITDEIELQINELQIKDNQAKLYLLVKELKENTDSPLNYKIFNSEYKEMYNSISKKKQDEMVYTEVLELKNYKDSCNEIKMEVYNKNKFLLKTITIDLLNKTIEARTENQVVKKISQIELNKFIKKETEKLYKEKELKNKQVVILDTYDIFYSDGRYVAKYLYMMPTDEEFEKDTVEKSTIYTNTIEFTYNEKEFIKIKIEKSEIF